MIWDAESFTIEFEKFKDNISNLILPSLFKKQIEIIEKLTIHWKNCHACNLGFYCCEYKTTFEEVWLNLVYYPQYHICDGDYKLLFTEAKL